MISNVEGVIPAVSGYYHNPPVWVGGAPQRVGGQYFDHKSLVQDVYRTSLSNGVKVRVRRDGLFVFDFSSWEQAGETTIPKMNLDHEGRVCKEHTAANAVAERRLLLRVLVMNVHQACINTAHIVKYKRAFPLCPIITAPRSIWLNRFEENLPQRIVSFDSSDVFHKYMVACASGSIDALSGSRRAIELDLVIYSFEMLDQVLTSEYKNILTIVELLYKSGVQYSESKNSESLILSWAVIEHVINHLWSEYISNENRENRGQERIPKKRLEKLTGRDYPVSVMTELLEISGKLDSGLYKEIDECRRARNAWLHSLDDVTDRIASVSINTACQLVHQVTGIFVAITLCRTGGTIILRDS